MRWFYLTLLVLIEMASCLSIRHGQPWVTIAGGTTMFLVMYGLSRPWKMKR
jgi:hypothetical protein